MHIQPASLLAARREMKQFITHPSLHVLTAAIAPRGTLKSMVEQEEVLQATQPNDACSHRSDMEHTAGWAAAPHGFVSALR